jgi:GNAT superfamily N-acetyltransferase
MHLDVIARRDAELTSAERERIAAWEADAYGGQTWAARYAWTPAEWRLLLRDGGEPVSHLAVVTRTALADGAPVRLGGIGSVMTPTALRGRGYASELMHRAAEWMFGAPRVEAGMLFCLGHLIPFYAGLGWTELPAVWIDHPAGRMRWPERAMVLPRPGTAWPGGEVDVRGLPW